MSKKTLHRVKNSDNIYKILNNYKMYFLYRYKGRNNGSRR